MKNNQSNPQKQLSECCNAPILEELAGPDMGREACVKCFKYLDESPKPAQLAESKSQKWCNEGCQCKQTRMTCYCAEYGDCSLYLCDCCRKEDIENQKKIALTQEDRELLENFYSHFPTKEQVIDLSVNDLGNTTWDFTKYFKGNLERLLFAKSREADERMAAEKSAWEKNIVTLVSNNQQNNKRVVAAAVKAERERCAGVAYDTSLETECDLMCDQFCVESCRVGALWKAQAKILNPESPEQGK